MIWNIETIERVLRQAPSPKPPDSLLEILRRQRPGLGSNSAFWEVPWWRRWIPAFAIGILMLGCLVVLGYQASQWMTWQKQRQAKKTLAQDIAQLREEYSTLLGLQAAQHEAAKQRRDYSELVALREEVRLGRELELAWQTAQQERERLQQEYAEALRQAGLQKEPDPLKEPFEKAWRIACISNLKQIGLAARIWANEYETTLLPTQFQVMSNEMNSTKILICPADVNRTPPANWELVNNGASTYHFMSVVPNETAPDLVYVRCPIHNNVGMSDGSAQMLSTNFQCVTKNGETRIHLIKEIEP